MAKTAQASSKKALKPKTKATSKKASSKKITKASKTLKATKSAKSTAAPPSPSKRPAGKGTSKSKINWVAPYEKKIRMFKNQSDYFGLNEKYKDL